MARGPASDTRRLRQILRYTVRVISILIALGVMGGFVYYLSGFMRTSEDFYVRKIQFEGLNRVSEYDAASASGLSSGDNIMLIDRNAVAENLEALPFVKTARVTVVFPDTVNITIREREPYASLIYRNDAYELDRERTLLRKLPLSEVPRSPMITELGNFSGIELGQPVPGDTPLQAAFDVWEAFSQTEVAAVLTLSEISAPDRDAITMYFDEVPYEIRWGRGGPEAQAARLEVLWRDRGGRLDCEEYLDLRFGDDIVCK